MSVAILALGLLVLAIVNLVVYQGTRTRLVNDHARSLARQADAMRDELRSVAGQLARSAEHVAASRTLGAVTTLDSPVRDDNPVVRELDRAMRSFRFHSVRLVRRDGVVLATGRARGPKDVARDQALVEQALRTGTTAIAPGRSPEPLLTFATPAAHAPGVVALFDASIHEHLRPALNRGGFEGAGSDAFLVMEEDGRIFPMSKIENRPGAVSYLTPDDLLYKPASMAARQVESSIDVPGNGWNVTRQVDDIGLGLVAHAHHAPLMTAMRVTLLGLLVLDLGTMVVLVGFVRLWRRQFRSGLERQRQDRAIRQSEDIAAVFDNAFDAILIFDSNGRVQIVNRAAERLFLRSSEEMIGAPSHQFLEWNTAGRPGAIEPLAIGRVSRTEIVRSDGVLTPVEFSLGFSGEGDSLLYTAIIRDIGDRVEAENRIRHFAQGLETSNRRLQDANVQLEEASRLKSEFLANTSHELRTPLNGIIGFLQLVLDGMADSPEEEREFMGQALHCSRHLLGLINDVLDIAKIEAGKLTVDSGPVEVAALFKEVHTLTHVQAAQKAVALSFVAPDLGATMARGDFGKIKQVLVNLVGNSIKFTPNGSITVSARMCPEAGHVMFDVVDTGVGIPKDRQRIIFEKFTQADGSTTRRFGGTGLGLAICRSLIELMGGVIGVESDGPGTGTRMYFALPIWRGEGDVSADDEPDENRITGPAGGPVVLVVEDDSVFRQFVTVLLHRHGYRTVEAMTADAAWMLARRLRPAVVMVDYALASSEGARLRTGLDLARRMAEEDSTRGIPMVFVTGFGDELVERLSETALTRRPEYLPKPVDARDLLRMVEKILGSTADRIVRILLADDDPAVAAYLRKVLREPRYHVEVVNDGHECLHALATQPRGFDLLLLDLMMPNLSGYDVLRHMVLTGEGTRIPVLVLTNAPEPRSDEERRLLDNGIVLDVVSKGAVHERHDLLTSIIESRVGASRSLNRPVLDTEAKEAA